MKVPKSIKNLKFWSRKNKRKKTIIHHHAPPPCCCCHQPSAPPLPPWEPVYDHHPFTSETKFSSFQGFLASNQRQFDPQQEEIREPMNPSSSGEVEAEADYSYQQYMVQKPVYAVPVIAPSKTHTSAGAVGCVFDTGAHLFRCVCPCFRIREI